MVRSRGAKHSAMNKAPFLLLMGLGAVVSGLGPILAGHPNLSALTVVGAITTVTALLFLDL